jgi:formyltetrahydrofolate deformylase
VPTATHVLTLACPDRPGIVASISQGLLDLGANIVENAQFSDATTARFCMRTRFDADEADARRIDVALRPRAESLGAELLVRPEGRRCRTLVLVSRQDHCLVDLLYRVGAGDLPIEVPVVLSNHTDLRATVEHHGIVFEHVPTDGGRTATAEARLLELVRGLDIELVVLARYMQILSAEVCEALAGRLINIHHSFLPGFKGARPYHQAWERGVKIIGATAHYATAELDDGPIIAQDVAAVSHHDTPAQLQVIGRDLERQVLSRAVRAHAEHRVFQLGARTVVFA